MGEGFEKSIPANIVPETSRKICSLKLVFSPPSKRAKQSDDIEWENRSPDWWLHWGLRGDQVQVHSELTFMTLFTYSMGPSVEIWNFSRTCLAIALNSPPGNQSGRYRTVQGFVSYLWMPD